MYDINNYLCKYQNIFILCIVITFVSIFLIIIIYKSKKLNRIKTKGIRSILLVLILGFTFINIKEILPRYIPIKIDIAEGSILIEGIGTLESSGGNTNEIVIDGTEYYIYDYYNPIVDQNNWGKTVKFYYYKHSKCIYNIEIVENSE
jgi:hypothetical protein